jgi:peroxiredoxin
MQTSTPGSAGKRNLIKVLAAGALLALGAGGYFSLSTHKTAPPVTFTAIDGSKFSAQSLRGKVVMVNFWATSCTTCVKEMPQMVETYNKYQRQGLEFVAVAMSYDPPDYVRNYAQSRQLPFKVALDGSGEVANAFGDVKLTPTTFVIDKQGKILKRYVGEPEFAELHQLLEKALAA